MPRRMTLVLVLGLVCATGALTSAAGLDPATCTYNGIPLYGTVQFVESFPDLTVQVVDAFPDLRVQFVDAFPDECGEWQEVTSFPDFTVQVVDAFPDIRIQYVDAFPGVPGGDDDASEDDDDGDDDEDDDDSGAGDELGDTEDVAGIEAGCGC